MENLEKSCNLKLVISRPGKVLGRGGKKRILKVFGKVDILV